MRGLGTSRHDVTDVTRNRDRYAIEAIGATPSRHLPLSIREVLVTSVTSSARGGHRGHAEALGRRANDSNGSCWADRRSPRPTPCTCPRVTYRPGVENDSQLRGANR